jgi:SAM-dependent methyltransferase
LIRAQGGGNGELGTGHRTPRSEGAGAHREAAARPKSIAIEDGSEFDGIWTCASLLHVPSAELPDVVDRLRTALKPGGILYASFKYGSGEREQHGRRFTDLDEAGLAALLEQVPGLEPVETWTTSDRRPGRESERWLNTLLRRTH